MEIMRGGIASCGGLVTRLAGLGALFGGPIENRPQVTNLPHFKAAIWT